MYKPSDIHLVAPVSPPSPTEAETLYRSLQLALERSDELQANQIRQQARIEVLLGTLAALEEAHDHYRGLYEASPVGHVTLDQELGVVALNLTGAAMLGGAKDAILSRNFMRFLAPWEAARFHRLLRRRTKAGRHQAIDLAFKRSDGSILQTQCQCVHGLLQDQLVHRLSLVDITERKRAENEIRQLAFHDALTSLPNRRMLLDRLQTLLLHAGKTTQYGAVAFIDLDDFKRLNDTLGHAVGDLFLQQVAQRLTVCVAATDTVARLGGDEFVVLFENMGKNAAVARARAEQVGEKLLACLSTGYALEQHTYQTSGSVGLTLFHDATISVETLLQQADLALYAAKMARPGKLRFFTPEMQASVVARGVLDTELRSALQEKQFLLHYQPQVDGRGQMTGVEALIRWQHPERGLVMPGDFIPYAEEKGLIALIGEQVMEAACTQLKHWESVADRAHLRIAINVSALEFCHPNFTQRTLALIDRLGVDASRLVLELTERVMLTSIEDTLRTMTTLKKRGLQFSLDDFGIGYSSLSYLQSLPLDQLKIDRTFIRDVLTNPSDNAITRSILALGQSLGLDVLAEGVETEAQRCFLAAHGCCAYQGYFFGYAEPAERLSLRGTL